MYVCVLCVCVCVCVCVIEIEWKDERAKYFFFVQGQIFLSCMWKAAQIRSHFY